MCKPSLVCAFFIFRKRGNHFVNNKLGTMPMPRLVANMALPLSFSLLVQSLYNIVDGIFVAKLSEAALTATSLVFPAQLLMIAVGVGTGVGVNAVLSRNIGAKNTQSVQSVATTGILLALLSAAAFMLFGVFGTEVFVNAFAPDEEIARYSTQYLSICMIFCAGSLVSTMVQRFLQAAGDAFYSMVSLVAGAVTNLILDPIFIFGLVGMPALGVPGAAIATVIGQWVSCAVAIALNVTKNPIVHVHWKGYRPDPATIFQIYKVGLPTIVTQAIGSVMVAAVNAILLPFSSSAVAFFGAYYKLQSFLFMPMNGLGQGAIPIVGYNYGAKNFSRIREALSVLLPVGIGISLVMTVLFELFPAALLGFFSPTPEMLALGVPALRIIAPTFAFGAVTIILGYTMSGLGNGLVNMIGTALRQLVVFVPLAYWLASRFGVDRVWYAIWVAELVAMCYAILASRGILRQKKHELDVIGNS
jgi:putative MATE family efflux protein